MLGQNLKRQLFILSTGTIATKFSKIKKKLAKLNNGKHSFRQGTKMFVNESLTPMNEPIVFNCRKLKLKELIHSCYNRNGGLNIKMTDKS